MGKVQQQLETYLDKKYSQVKGVYAPELTRVRLSDRILAATVLPFIPPAVSPNQLTFVRYLLIPLVIFSILVGNILFGTLLFVLAVFTDALDGAMARTKDMITDWGIINDPLADKLLISSTAAVLVSIYMSFLLAATIIGIEVVLILLAYVRYRSDIIVPAKWAGKTKMVLQSFGLGFIFLFLLFDTRIFHLAAEYTLYGAVLFGLLSLVVYRSA